MRLFLLLPAMFIGMAACGRNGEWDLPVEGVFDVVVVRMEPNACPAPVNLILTVREMKGTQTVGDEWADYMATFTQAGKTPVRFCGTKICEGKGLHLPWSSLKEDDCPISELSLDACEADEAMFPDTVLPRGQVWDLSSNSAYRGAMEGKMYSFRWFWDAPTTPTCAKTDVEFYLHKR